MGDYGSRLTDFSQKIALSGDNFVIFRQILMKLEIWVGTNPKLSPLLKGRYAWVTMGHAWLILVEKIAFSGDNLVIFRPNSMKLEMWVDINPKLSPLKGRYAWVTMGHAWLVLVEKIAHSEDNFVILDQSLICLGEHKF